METLTVAPIAEATWAVEATPALWHPTAQILRRQPVLPTPTVPRQEIQHRPPSSKLIGR